MRWPIRPAMTLGMRAQTARASCQNRRAAARSCRFVCLDAGQLQHLDQLLPLGHRPGPGRPAPAQLASSPPLTSRVAMSSSICRWAAAARSWAPRSRASACCRCTSSTSPRPLWPLGPGPQDAGQQDRAVRPEPALPEMALVDLDQAAGEGQGRVQLAPPVEEVGGVLVAVALEVGVAHAPGVLQDAPLSSTEPDRDRCGRSRGRTSCSRPPPGAARRPWPRHSRCARASRCSASSSMAEEGQQEAQQQVGHHLHLVARVAGRSARRTASRSGRRRLLVPVEAVGGAAERQQHPGLQGQGTLGHASASWPGLRRPARASAATRTASRAPGLVEQHLGLRTGSPPRIGQRPGLGQIGQRVLVAGQPVAHDAPALVGAQPVAPLRPRPAGRGPRE